MPFISLQNICWPLKCFTCFQHREQVAEVIRYLPPDQYDVEEELRATGTSEIYLLKSTKTGLLAIRKLTKVFSGGPHELKAHMEWLRPHANIVHVFDASLDGKELTLTMEYCAAGDLDEQMARFQRMSEAGRPRPMSFVLHVFASMIQALAYLHYGILVSRSTSGKLRFKWLKEHACMVHADIKPMNIFLRWSESPQCPGLPDVVLGDFGLCRPADKPQRACGTIDWMAPEVYDAMELYSRGGVGWHEEPMVLTRASDVYSIGLCVVRLAGDDVFEQGAEHGNALLDIADGSVLQPAVRACLKKNPEARMKMNLGTTSMLKMYLRRILDARAEAALEPIDDILWMVPPRRDSAMSQDGILVVDEQATRAEQGASADAEITLLQPATGL